MCAHRKERITTASEKNVIRIDAAHDHPAIREVPEWDAILEIAY
jgi:hypothetical protein